MGNFEKLSVLVIVVIIIMILFVAIYTWQDDPAATETADGGTSGTALGHEADSPYGADPQPDRVGGSGEIEIRDSDTVRDEPDRPADVDPVGDGTDPAVPGPEGPGVGGEPTPSVVSNEPWDYVVKSGDVLSKISEGELGTMRRWREIVRMNPGVDPDRLRVGQVLKMPPRQAKVGPAPMRGGMTAGGTSPSGGPTPGQTYTTRGVERLDRIAKAAYGNIDRWPTLFALNKDKITDPHAIPPGTQLVIPR